MKILHCVLYSPDEEYQKMYEITSPYYQQFDNVTTVYYSYQENLEEPFKKEGDRLLIKGKEEYGPAIMEKTIRTFEYFQSTLSSYDYVVRSNISTIVRFDLLQHELINQRIAYGGFMKDLQWTDPSCGIHDSRWFGTMYASGICILFSSSTILHMLENRNQINKEVIDDIAFGIFAKEHSIPSTDISPYVIWMRDHHRQTHELIQLLQSHPHVMVYRNRVRPERPESRWEDIEQMRHIISFLNHRL